jgi:DNA topoisomerase VI subunit B
LKRYMKACLSDLYRKVSKQIRQEMHLKDAENRLRLYKYYIPLIVTSISESIDVSAENLTNSFLTLVEKHVKKEVSQPRSLMTNVDNDSIQERRHNIQGKHKGSRSKETSLVIKPNKSLRMKRVDSTQEKIENFMTSSGESG